jgi:rubrerythrin
MAPTLSTSNALLDKMGERLAMERSAIRLYDALQAKIADLGAQASAYAQLDAIRADKARHAELMQRTIASIGSDPATMTPSAGLVEVEAIGLFQVLKDPHTSLSQSLHAVLTAELSDSVGWETLVALAHEHGQLQLAEGFSDALLQERRHLAMLQTWYEQAVGLDASMVASTAQPEGGQVAHH